MFILSSDIVKCLYIPNYDIYVKLYFNIAYYLSTSTYFWAYKKQKDTVAKRLKKRKKVFGISTEKY